MCAQTSGGYKRCDGYHKLEEIKTNTGKFANSFANKRVQDQLLKDVDGEINMV